MKKYVLWIAGVLALASMGAGEPGAATYESGMDLTALRAIERQVVAASGKPDEQRAVEQTLIGLLAGPATFEARRFACNQLAVVGTDRAVPSLAPLLKDPQTAGIACVALVNIPSPNAAEALRSALPGSTGLARVQIIMALGDRRDADAVPALIPLAAGDDIPAVEAAAGALGRIASAPAVVALRKIHGEGRAETASAVIDGLLVAADRLIAAGNAAAAAAIYNDLKGSERTDVRRAALAGLLRLDADGGRARIIETLRAADAFLRPVAIDGVRRLKDADASRTFAAFLPQLPPAEQVMLLEALADRGDADAKAALSGQLAAEEPAVRIAAIAGLGRVGDVAAAPSLVHRLSSTRADEQAAAEQALVDLRGGDNADRAILAELAKTQGPGKARLVTAIARRNSTLAMPAMLAAAADADPSVAQAAFDALARLGSAAELPGMIDRLTSTPSADIRRSAESSILRVLASIDVPAQRGVIVRDKLASASGAEARIAVIRLLPTAADDASLAAVVRLTADVDPAVRDAAVRALADWRTPAAWDHLIAISGKAATPTHRVLALRGLVRLASESNAKPDDALIARYRQLLLIARDANDVKLVLGALSGVSHPDALPLAVSQLANPAVRPEAELAVKKIANAVKASHPKAAEEAMNKLK